MQSSLRFPTREHELECSELNCELDFPTFDFLLPSIDSFVLRKMPWILDPFHQNNSKVPVKRSISTDKAWAATRQVSVSMSVSASTERQKHIRLLKIGKELREELHDSLTIVSFKTNLW